MRSQKLVLAALAFVMLTGCGRAASGVTTDETWTLSYDLKDTITSENVPVGVKVDGRVYPKGKAPSVAATPAPEAPAAGKGHLRVVVKLAHKAIQAEYIQVRIEQPGIASRAHAFNSSEFVGSTVEKTFTHLPPGAYTVITESLGAGGLVVHTKSGSATVEADKSSELEI